MNVHFISLGCPRNLVDTEMMLGRLLEEGHAISSDASHADCIVVNTCAFIRPAVDESIDIILEMTRWKKEVDGRQLVVTGCLPQRYGMDLADSLPEVDAFLGTGAFHLIGKTIANPLSGARMCLPPLQNGPGTYTGMARLQITPPHMAYIKIAEGCSNHCTYCIIPKLRGRQRSRPIEEILSEANTLVKAGTKELVLIAQNTAAYGQDMDGDNDLAELLRRLARIPKLIWIRVLYGHPDYINNPLIEAVATLENVCPYFDIPIQHASERILKRMGRSHDISYILELFKRIRYKVPGAVIRTSLMTGFPGETESDFTQLIDLIEKVKFDHLGVFIYSDGKDLPSSKLKSHLDYQVKQKRFEHLMKRQAGISRENNRKYIGTTLSVLVDKAAEGKDGMMIGRTAFQAPEIDGIVYINGTAEPGSLVTVQITEAHEYDLAGDII